MKNVLVFMLVGFLFGCAKKSEEVKESAVILKPYIISEKAWNGSEKNDSVPPPPPIPGWLTYGTNAFIINSDSTAYYLQNKQIGMICGTVTNDTIPYFINLQPEDLVEISNKNIYDFIKLNYKDDFRHVTVIASESDTLKTKFFFDLYKSLNFFKRDRDFFIIRRTTQEEDTVLKYKRSNKYFDSDFIKWDKSKIKFPEYIKFAKRPNH